MEQRRIFAVYSGKGGAGCTASAAGLAAAYAAQGFRTLAVDLDAALHGLSFAFGMQDRALFSLDDALDGRISFERLFLHGEALPQLSFCPAPETPGRLAGQPEKDAFFAALDAFGFERVVFDLPGRDSSARDSLLQTGAAWILVCRQDPSAILACERAAEELDKEERLLLINAFDLSDLPSYRQGRTTAQEMIDRARTPLISIVPRDETLARTLEEGRAEYLPQTAQGIPYANAVGRLEGRTVPLFTGAGGEKLRKRI